LDLALKPQHLTTVIIYVLVEEDLEALLEALAAEAEDIEILLILKHPVEILLQEPHPQWRQEQF